MEQVRKQCNRAVYAWAFHAKWHLCNLPCRKNVDSIFLLEHKHVWCFGISRSVNLVLYWSLDPCVYGCIYKIVKIYVCILICQDKQTCIYIYKSIFIYTSFVFTWFCIDTGMFLSTGEWVVLCFQTGGTTCSPYKVRGWACCDVRMDSITPLKTNGWIPKMMGWKIYFLWTMAIFDMYMRFLGCGCSINRHPATGCVVYWQLFCFFVLYQAIIPVACHVNTSIP